MRHISRGLPCRRDRESAARYDGKNDPIKSSCKHRCERMPGNSSVRDLNALFSYPAAAMTRIALPWYNGPRHPVEFSFFWSTSWKIITQRRARRHGKRMADRPRLVLVGQRQRFYRELRRVRLAILMLFRRHLVKRVA